MTGEQVKCRTFAPLGEKCVRAPLELDFDWHTGRAAFRLALDQRAADSLLITYDSPQQAAHFCIRASEIVNFF